MKKGLALFDLDGTITFRDTLLEFIRFTKGNFKFYSGFLIHVPVLCALKLGFISHQAAKEKILEYFFRNTPEEIFEKQCIAFTTSALPRFIRAKAMEEIIQLKNRGWQVVIVSASPENWIRGWAGHHQLDLIATQLEIKDGLITGRIKGKNCRGYEKVKRILERFHLTEYDLVYAYGDTGSDKPMMELATTSFYKPFRSCKAP